MNIVTGYTGTAHITSAQDRAGNQGAIGTGSYILNIGQKLATVVQSATEVRVKDGAVCHQGCIGVIEAGSYDSVTIANGNQGMKRIDLIVCRYTKDSGTGVEDLTLVCIQGTEDASTPVAPSYNSGDIQNGDSPVDMPLFYVNINGITISSVTQVADNVMTQAETDTLLATIEPAVDMFNIRDVLTVSSYSASSASWKDLGTLSVPANTTSYTQTVKITVSGTFLSPTVGAYLRMSVYHGSDHYGVVGKNAIDAGKCALTTVTYITMAPSASAVTLHLMASSDQASWTMENCMLAYEVIKEA